MLYLLLILNQVSALVCNPYLCEPSQSCDGQCAYSCLSSQCSSSAPTSVYVDYNNLNSGRDGSSSNPYKTLLEVFNSNTNGNIKILFSPGTHVIDYVLPTNTISDLSVGFISNCNPCTTLATLKLQTVNFMFPDSDVSNMYFENIIIDGEQAMDSSCNSMNCGYCAYHYDTSTSNNYVSSCSSQEENSLVNLISIGPSTNLFIVRTKFQNMRQDLKSIIYSSGGHILMSDVDFYNIKVYDSNSNKHGAITIQCTSSPLCSDSFVYSGGSVSLLGNGYTYYDNIVQSSFLLAKFPGTIKISSVNFSYNLALCGAQIVAADSLSGNCPSMFYISNCEEQIIFENNNFWWNYSFQRFIYILYDSSYILNPKYMSNGRYMSFANSKFKSNNFTENASNYGLIEIYFSTTSTNVELDTNYFIRNVIDTAHCSLIRVWSDYWYNYNLYGAAGGSVTVSGVTVQADPDFINLNNLVIESCFASNLFYGKSLLNLHAFNIAVTWNYPSFHLVNDVVINQFISKGYLTGKFSIFEPKHNIFYFFYIQGLYSASIDTLSTRNNPTDTLLYQLFSITSIWTWANFTNISADSLSYTSTDDYLIYLSSDNSGSVKMSQMRFSNIVNDKSQGLISIQSVNNLEIWSTTITNSEYSYSSISLQKAKWIVISDLQIDHSQSYYYGGCIYAKPAQDKYSKTQMKIENSVFNFCKSNKGAGLYLNYDEDATVILMITNTIFSNGNSADGGSAIFFKNNFPLDSSSFITKSTFSNNYSYKTGALTLYYAGYLTVSDSFFTGNTAGIGSSAFYGFFQDNGKPLKLINNEFSGNSGGKVLHFQSIIQSCQILSDSNIFQNHSTNTVILLDKIEWVDTNSQFVDNDQSILAQSISKVELTGTSFTKHTSTQLHIIEISQSEIYCESCSFKNNQKKCVSVSGPSSSTFKSCEFSGNSCSYKGGAILYTEATGTNSISDCKFKKNYIEEGGVINIVESTVTVENSEIKENASAYSSPGIILNTAVLNVSNTVFAGQSSSGQGAFIIGSFSSSIYIEKSSFSGGYSESGGSIALSGGLLVMKDSSLSYSIGSLYSSGIYGTDYCNITIKNSDFSDLRETESTENSSYMIHVQGVLQVYDSKFSNFKSGAIFATETSYLNIQDDEFYNGASLENGGAVLLQNVKYGQILRSSFINNTSRNKGGAVYIDSQYYESPEFTISNCLLKNNSAISEDNEGSGGGIYLLLSNTKVSITDNDFDSNSAITGGGIFISCSYNDKNCLASIKKNMFTNNSAIHSGGAIRWAGSMPEISNNTYQSSNATYGSDVASFPYKFELVISDSQRQLTSFSGVGSSQKFPSPIKLRLLDHYSQVVAYGSDDLEVIIMGDSNTNLIGTTSTTPDGGIIIFDDFSIIAVPGSEINITISAPYISFSGQNIECNVSVALRTCIKGEFQQSNSCIACNNGTYSLSTDDQCSDCPAHAHCYGGSLIAPNSGYWRGSNDSARIYECLNKGACLGGLLSDIGYISTTGICSAGCKGNLCQACEIGYSYSSSNVCAVCDNSWTIIKICFIILGVALALAILVRTTIISAYEPTSVMSIYLKIFVNYLQLVSLAAQLRLSWPGMVSSFVEHQSKTGEVSTQFFSFDCLLISKDDPDSYKTVYFTKLWICSLIPIILGLIVFMFWLSIGVVKKSLRVMKREFIATLCILFFLIHPSLTNYMFSAFSCMDIYEEKYLMKNLDIKCWDGTHTVYAFCIALPSIIIWSIGVPLFVFQHLTRNKRKLYQIEYKIKYGFLYDGYQESRFYWEFVVMMRKMWIIFLSAIFNAISPNIQALTCLSILLVFIYFQHIKRPFELADLNEMELRGVFVSAVTIYCGLYFLTNDLNDGSKWFFFFLMIFSNAVFLVFWVYKVLRELATSLFSYNLNAKEIFGIESKGVDDQIEAKKKATLISDGKKARREGFYRSDVDSPESLYLKFFGKIGSKLALESRTCSQRAHARSNARINTFFSD
ncbi:unnamed protein product [Blepharisma stoltei]|uniref:Adhesin-like protein n=1 Tax=Blepharisma stoltei TaxID=1481888 RepID=A0AAU9JXD6_9CILI|nr:unnamed protein product [Blepharisma stoltei]